MEERERETEAIEATEKKEETGDRGKKRPRTDTDPECMQSRQMREQMKSIFLSDSDEEAIVDFVKQHEVLFDKTHTKVKDKQRKERLWETVAASRNFYLSELCSQKVVRDTMHQIWQAHTDQVRPICSQEHQETDLAEGQFQLFTRSPQKEGNDQVCWI